MEQNWLLKVAPQESWDKNVKRLRELYIQALKSGGFWDTSRGFAGLAEAAKVSPPTAKKWLKEEESD